MGVFFVGLKVGLWPSVAGVLSGLVALGVVWLLARGLTSPLRDMVAATEAMARGDFTARVTAFTLYFARIPANQPATAMLYVLIITVVMGMVPAHLLYLLTGVGV